MSVTVTESGATPRSFLRAIDKAAKGALELAVDDWHEDFAPGHFEEENQGKYGYQPRTLKYTNSKVRRFGHSDPLAYTGASKRKALANIRVSSRVNRATSRFVAVGVMDVPEYFYKYHAKQSDKANELTRTTADEELVLEKNYAQSFEDLASLAMQRSGSKRTKLT